MHERNPLIVCLNETHITDDIEEKELEISGYKFVASYSSSRHTGGTLIYVKHGVNITELDKVACNPYYWSVMLKLQVNKECIICISIYRSPNSNGNEFLNYFEEILNNDLINANKTIILGDFNINFNSNNSMANRLKNIITDSGFKQIIVEDTRVTSVSSTLIDLVITNDTNLKELPRNLPNLSDHRTLAVEMTVKDIETKKKYMHVRNLNRDNIDKIIADLNMKNWDYTSTDVNVLYTNFIGNIMSSINKICPEKRILAKVTPWINKNVKQAQKERNEAYKTWELTRTDCHWEEYKAKRNRVTTVIRQERIQYYEKNIDECRGDNKKMWRTVKELSSRTQTGDFDVDKISFDKHSSTLEENFNNFYYESIKDIANSIEDKPFDLQIEAAREQIKFSLFRRINLSQLKKIVFSVKNKSTGDDGFSVKLLKDLFCVIGYPLLNIVNTSLETGRVPSLLKISTIIPIPKVASPTKPEQCRPINLLPVVDKILEIIVSEQLREYVEKNNILFVGQSGFRQNHSCETALQFVCAKWRKEISEDNVVLSVFVDLKRAFETIERSLLVKKLYRYGIENNVLKWLEDYLDGRYHRTKIMNKMSSKIASPYGVPQGSVLGPLLFIIYVNDIHRVLNNSYVNLFADDTVITVAGRDFDSITNTLNSELDILYDWLCGNKLKLNSDKTKLMVLGSRSLCNKFLSENYTIKINECTIEKVDQIKYLGVMLDPQLTFSHQVNYMCKKIGKKIGFFRRIAANLTQWSKLLIYNTIIYPHFTYCASLLIACNNQEIGRVQLLQNKAMRIVLNCNSYTSVKLMLSTLNWLSVEQSIKKANLVLVYKIINGKVPTYLQMLKKRRDIHNYNIRSKNNYDIELVKKSFLQGSLFHEGLRLFNAMPNDIKEAPNVNVFVKKVCKYLTCN